MTLRIAFRHRWPGSPTDLDIALDAPTPGTTVLFGPSGAGKSTIAAVAAGLLRPEAGHVSIDGTILADSAAGIFLPPDRRRVGSVFQDALLFPHLSVAANLRYGLRRSPPGRIGLDAVVSLLGVEHLLDRRPASLSGGERQRIAIGRALLAQPRLLIMDEPLASLDAARRGEILPYLARLRDTLALPILYITHALDEVARLADTLVLVERGRCTAAGPLADLLARVDLPLAARDDAGMVLHCQILAHLPDRHLSRLSIEGAEGIDLLIPLQTLPVATRLRVRIPAGEVILATARPDRISVHNILPARIHAIAPHGHAALVELRLGQVPLLAHITRDAVTALDLGVGSAVLALVKAVSVRPLA